MIFCAKARASPYGRGGARRATERVKECESSEKDSPFFRKEEFFKGYGGMNDDAALLFAYSRFNVRH